MYDFITTVTAAHIHENILKMLKNVKTMYLK